MSVLWFMLGVFFGVVIAGLIFMGVVWLPAKEKSYKAIAPLPQPVRPPLEIQTSPMLQVELSRGSQRPLDLVVCIDSSCSVGKEDFDFAKDFVQRFVAELEMPIVQVGVLRFNHEFSVVSGITGNKGQLLADLHETAFEPGETKLGPPLAYANKMLGTHMLARKNQAILVLTDGEPNDSYETEREAALLKNCGVQLFFVQLGRETLPLLSKLASAPSDKNVLHVQSYKDLSHHVEHVLSAIVTVSQLVSRAKCSLTMQPYQVVPDLDLVDGLEILVPGWERKGAELRWRAGECLEHDEFIHWQPGKNSLAMKVPILAGIRGKGIEQRYNWKPRPDVTSPEKVRLNFDGVRPRPLNFDGMMPSPIFPSGGTARISESPEVCSPERVVSKAETSAPTPIFPQAEMDRIFDAIFTEDLSEGNETVPQEVLEDNEFVSNLIEVASKGEVFDYRSVCGGRDGQTYVRVLKSDGDGSLKAYVEQVPLQPTGSQLVPHSGTYSRA